MHMVRLKILSRQNLEKAGGSFLLETGFLCEDNIKHWLLFFNDSKLKKSNYLELILDLSLDFQQKVGTKSYIGIGLVVALLYKCTYKGNKLKIIVFLKKWGYVNVLKLNRQNFSLVLKYYSPIIQRKERPARLNKTYICSVGFFIFQVFPFSVLFYVFPDCTFFSYPQALSF